MENFLMFSRITRVIIMSPFYMLFEFFLIKYIFLIFHPLDDLIVLGLAIFAGLIHLVPNFFEARKSTVFGRFISNLSGIWMWASVMFLIDIIIIYVLSVFIHIPTEIDRCQQPANQRKVCQDSGKRQDIHGDNRQQGYCKTHHLSP